MEFGYSVLIFGCFEINSKLLIWSYIYLWMHRTSVSLGLTLAPSLAPVFFSAIQTNPPKSTDSYTVFPQSYLVLCVVISATTETECAAIFAGGQQAVAPRTILLNDMGHIEPPAIILCDNTEAIGIATDSIRQKFTKAIDIRGHWIRD
jgi:hypothetical protein